MHFRQWKRREFVTLLGSAAALRATQARAGRNLQAGRLTGPAPACEIASTFASDICAASSTNSTSTDPWASGRAQSHAVPAPTWQGRRATEQRDELAPFPH